MQRIIYVTGRCDQCGKLSSRLVNAAIADEDLAPVQCDSCGGEIKFSEMEVWHHLIKEDAGEAQPKRRGILNIPSESVAEINTLVIVCLCLCAVSIFNRYLEDLSQLQTMALAMGVTLALVSCWLLGREWFRSCREREEAELREKYQREGKFLRDLENRSKEMSSVDNQSSES